MGRKSSIDTLPLAIKTKLGKLIKENRLTLDQISAELKEFAGDQAPSRTAIWRHKDAFEKVIKHTRERLQFVKIWAQEVGAEPDSDQGRMLVEMMQTLLTDTVMAASEGQTLDPKAARELALAIKAAAEAGGLSLKQQDLIETRTREKLIREQQTELDGMKRAGMITQETLVHIRERVYGIKAKAAE